jgi:hypothetical protein
MKIHFEGLCRGRLLLLVGTGWLSLFSTASVLALSPCDRQDLAIRIRDNSRITLNTYHPSGVVDNANARQNIIDTANGGQAHNSCYGNAPCGTTWLDPRMLDCMDQLANVYGYSYGVTELAGGSHTVGSWHYYGRAMDIYSINGVGVDASNPYVNAFIQVCYNFGANYVFLENNDHVHAQWADDGGNVAPSGCPSPLTYGYCVGPIAMNTDGTLEMFGVTANNTPAHEYQNNPNGSWTAMFNMGGITGVPGVTVARNPDGRLEIFCVNSADKKVYHNYQNSPHSSWSGWFAQNATGVTNLNALTNADGRLEVFGIGSNGDVWHNYQSTPGGSWNGWVDHPGAHIKAGYVVAKNGDGRLEVFGVGDNGDVWHDWQTSAGGAWHGYADMGGAGMNPRLSIGQNADGRLELYGIGSNGNVWHNYQVVGGGGAWNGWGDVGSFGVGAKPGMAVGINPDGRLEVFGVTTAGVVWHRYQNAPGSGWTAWSSLGGSGLDSQLMVANNANGALQVFAISGNDLSIWTNYQTTPGGGWNGWFSMGNAGVRFFYGQP